MLYAEDSFFTLGVGGQIGLVALSLAMAALCLGLVWWAAEGLKRVWRVLIAVAVFWLFLWVSPQVYYGYYVAIFDDLPWQNVIKAPPSLTKLARVVTFTDRATLSEHSQGGLAWLMVVVALLRRRTRD